MRKRSTVVVNRVFNEDCLQTMSNMEENIVDLVVTSPPYEDLRDYEGFSFDFENTALLLYKILKPGGTVAWVINDKVKDSDRSAESFRQCLFFKHIGFNFHDVIIWNKRSSNFKPRSNAYNNIFEFIFILTKGKQKTFNPLCDKKNRYGGKPIGPLQREKDGSFRYTHGGLTGKKIAEYGKRNNIWEIPVGGHHSYSFKKEYIREHSAVFPENLAVDLVYSYSNPGDLVYDPFMGSGTTAVASVRLGRYFLGSEICTNYVKIIARRLSEETECL